METKRTAYLTLLSPEEARRRWFAALEDAPLPEEVVPLATALHRITARPVAARRSSPAFHGAAMDGMRVDPQVRMLYLSETLPASASTLPMTLFVQVTQVDADTLEEMQRLVGFLEKLRLK